jgi:hypothetical protein
VRFVALAAATLMLAPAALGGRADAAALQLSAGKPRADETVRLTLHSQIPARFLRVTVLGPAGATALQARLTAAEARKPNRIVARGIKDLTLLPDNEAGSWSALVRFPHQGLWRLVAARTDQTRARPLETLRVEVKSASSRFGFARVIGLLLVAALAFYVSPMLRKRRRASRSNE